METKYLVKATDKYIVDNHYSVELNRTPEIGEEWVVSEKRYNFLSSHGFVSLVKEIKEEAEINENSEEGKIKTNEITPKYNIISEPNTKTYTATRKKNKRTRKNS